MSLADGIVRGWLRMQADYGPSAGSRAEVWH